MPTYGDDKVRNLVRSILPSTRRKGAREDKAIIHRRARRYERQQIRSFVGDWDEFDGPLNDRTAGRQESTEDELIGNAMWDRRGGDKLGAIMRWGPTVVAGVRREDRLSKLRSLLPRNTIGRHAISHLRYHDDLYIPDDINWRRCPRYADYISKRQADREELIRRVRLVIVSGNHGRFNTYVKRSWPRDTSWQPVKHPYRPLLGVHDVEDYVRDVVLANEPGRYFQAKDVVIAALEHVGC